MNMQLLPNIVVINITNLYGNVLQLKERIDHQILKVKGVTSTSCNKDWSVNGSIKQSIRQQSIVFTITLQTVISLIAASNLMWQCNLKIKEIYL